ncbi:MAG TPA: gluconeogenesis factor YvcK family protein [Dehalococcoidia bacterium]|nr:gluconeogenesis factor YvcK family protein [Dehalococcoidia bacterium]
MSKKRIVVVGGGNGNHTTLTGLRTQNCDLSAVVTMTDSGGSSGRLRNELGHLPPGDIRRCLMALASGDESGNLMRRLFDFRFSSGNGLSGHNFGNLLLTALTEVTGNIVTAVEEASKLLGIKGQVLPVTLTRSNLVARLVDGTEISGESTIDLRQENLNVCIDYVELDPKAYVYPPVLDAIRQADAIVLGPGDIYTSVLPNLLVEDVAEAINASGAVKVHVCNLMTKPAESKGFKASNFVKLLIDYLGRVEPLDFLIYNNSPLPQRLLQRYAADGQYPVELDLDETQNLVRQVLSRPILAAGVKLRHDPYALAEAIMETVAGPEPGLEGKMAG